MPPQSARPRSIFRGVTWLSPRLTGLKELSPKQSLTDPVTAAHAD